MLDLKALLAKILERLTTDIVTEEYDLGAITFTSGTIGSTATNISKTVTKTGYDPICLAVSFTATNVVGFRPFFSADKSTAYTQVIRGQQGAFSGTTHAFLTVTYKKVGGGST